MFRLKKGLNDCTNEEYHGDKNYLSSSNLKLLLKDPALFKKEVLDGKRENVQKNAFDEGSYAHTLILEPEQVGVEYAFYAGYKKVGKAFEDFKELNKGKIILSKPQKHRVESWVESYKNRPEAVNLVSGGKPELSLAGELMGVPIKVRADYINFEDGYIADVKTTSYSPDIDSFRYVVESLRYDLSAALYCELFSQYYGKPFDFYFIVLGKRDIVCEVYKASEETMSRGKMLVHEALGVYKKCLESGIWESKAKFRPEIVTDYEILEI